jgi:menaquinol-cytochrome c reductase iron-sulfur subunit
VFGGPIGFNAGRNPRASDLPEVAVAENPADPHDPQPSAEPAGGARQDVPDSTLAASALANPTSARAAVDRGRFLAGATVGVGAVMSAVIGVPALTFALAPVFETPSYHEIDLGPVSNFPEDKANPYKVVTFESQPNDTSGISRRVVFVRNDGNGEFVAISNTCMHLGCPVRNFGRQFACPCHGGQYDFEGRRTAGPPVRPLNRYKTKVVNGHLILHELVAVSSVDADGTAHTDQLKGPGQPTEGVLSFLYPNAPQQ